MSIVIEDISYVYMAGTPLATEALHRVSLTIEPGEFIGLIGPTGSGKSTLAQHLNGLLKPTKGRVIVDGVDPASKKADLRSVRSKVGMVFQYPEHQLFEETVYADVAFGPRNMALDDREIDVRVREALETVQLDFKDIRDRSPFELSGGQKRRVAIAGVLAMQPRYLVLDEPTAGLDPQGRNQILGQIEYLHRIKGIAVVFVSHNMEEVARVAQKILVLHRGEMVMMGSPREVFRRADVLAGIGLGLPPVTELMYKLSLRGKKVPTDIFTVREARDAILTLMSSSVLSISAEVRLPPH